jgi:hypothetical protein
MEQHLDTTYLRSDIFSKSAALSLAVISVGLGALLAGWGISFLWRPMVLEHRGCSIISPPTKMVLPATVPEPPKGKSISAPAIQEEVVVFWSVKHGSGSVVTGWKFPNGSGRTPTEQYCYYNAPNTDYSSTKIDIAANEAPSTRNVTAQVPDLRDALKKCRWWQP